MEELWKVLNDLSIKPKTEDDFIDEVQMDSQNDKYDENIHPSNTKKWSVKEEEKKLVIQDSVESPDKEPIEEKINLETEQEIQPKPMAVFKCEKCKNFDRYLILKDDIVYFECVECKNLKMYPKRMQNVATNIKCSKCDEKYVIRYNFYSGPYLYCKSCDLSALIRFYLK